MKRQVLVLVALLSMAAPAVVVAQGPPVYPPEGCVISEGLPAAPTLQKAGGGVLTFTFNSPQQPWTQAEEDTLRSWIAQFVPVMEDVFGPSAFSLTINVVKDSTMVYAGTYSDIDTTIRLFVASQHPLQVVRDKGVLVHETGHAFRHGVHLYGGWEEGMVRALEVEVHRRLGWAHWDASHSYTYDVWHEALNEPDIGGDFYGTVGLLLLRYQQAGYAWKKVYLEKEDFFKQFNSSLYADPNISGYESRLIALAASIVDSVEGQQFAAWYSRQYVFATTAPQGRRLYNVVSSFWIMAFVREGVVVTGLADTPVYWSVYDHEWAVLDSGTVTTNFLGGAGYYRWPFLTYSGRGTVVLEMADATPDTATRFYDEGREDTFRWGLFGVIEGLDYGTVEVTCIDSFITARTQVVKGGFEIPELEPIRGRFQIKVTANDGRYWIRYFNKDASSYFVLVDGPVIRPTHVAETLTLGPGSFYLSQNYPNPFNPSTKIVFELPQASEVRLKVFTTTGQEMATVVNGFLNAGRHSYTWQAPANLASGVYFCHLKAGGLSDTKKMILMR